LVVARRFIEPDEAETTLFAMGRYVYRAWVTNLPLTPAGVWHLYDGRAEMEPRIRELREDFALRIPTASFAANALFLEIVRLAYNLVTAFQRTCLEESWQSLTLQKLRYKLFMLPGELTRPKYRPVLRLRPWERRKMLFTTPFTGAAAERITVFVSAGDNGPAGCDLRVSYNPARDGLNVSGLASTAYNVAVGGTEFDENSSDATYWLTTARISLRRSATYPSPRGMRAAIRPRTRINAKAHDCRRCGRGVVARAAVRNPRFREIRSPASRDIQNRHGRQK
jgi:hypothetical protein